MRKSILISLAITIPLLCILLWRIVIIQIENEKRDDSLDMTIFIQEKMDLEESVKSEEPEEWRLLQEEIDLEGEIEMREREEASHGVRQVEPVSKWGKDEFQAGMNLLIYGHPELTEASHLFKHVSQLGINSVALVFPLFQADWQANEVKVSPQLTPTLEEIHALIMAAQAENLSLMLRPILDEESIMESGHWRGEIQPQNVEKWFESYRTLMLLYAELAQATHVEVFNIGTEFNSLQNQYSAEWVQLIKEIREVYEGKLIYSFNWDRVADIPVNEFIPLLDYVGLDAYFPLAAPDGASVAVLEEAWAKWVQELEPWLSKESIIITEVGMLPVAGAYRTPYEWIIPGGILDRQAQANYYQATYNLWQPRTRGIYWWCVTLSEPDPGVVDYSPLGGPAEVIIKEVFSK